MLIRSKRFTKKTAVYIIIAAAVLSAALVLILAEPADGDMGATAGRVAYLSRLGWEAEPESETREVIVLPRELEGVMAQYNELQRGQGFDLAPYCGMQCILYTYNITNYPNGDAGVTAQLFICGTKVIAGDIHSPALDGFMHGLKQQRP
ncbi:MAG: DUF4830 domain-containing protein [Oscillospiraceae bacterium]